MSVTVVCQDADLADLLSTAFFVMKGEEALPLAERLGVNLVMVNAEGRIFHTPGLSDNIEVLPGGAYRYDPR
jgi:thiamine biosynthesis lipoprotein ApbE